MKTFIRKHIILLDGLSVAVIVLTALFKDVLPDSAIRVLLLVGLLGLFGFTLCALPKRPACPNCGFRDYRRYQKFDNGLYRCPRCGAILRNESTRK